MCQTIYFPEKFTYGVGLGVNTCERARAAKFPLRGAEIEVQMQKGTLQIYTVKQSSRGHKAGWRQRGSGNSNRGNPRPFQLYGVQWMPAQTEEQTQYIWLIGLIGSCSCP